MSLEPQRALEAVDSPAYVMTAQERLFVDGVLAPVMSSKVTEVWLFMEEDLAKEFSLVCGDIGQLSHEITHLRDSLKTQVLSLQGELLTRIDNQITTFATTLPPSSRSEPPLLPDVSFSGDSQFLDLFLYSIYDLLAAHSACFADEGRQIKWVARHF